MAQQTLLTMVQNILSAMSSDEVNSISDTVESMQVAQILQNKYYDLVARGDLTLDEQLFQLNPSDNSNSPVVMTLPATCSRIDWLQYLDTNPLDNTQTDQFGAFSHDLNTDIIPDENIPVLTPTINWTTTSTTSIVFPGGNFSPNMLTFTVASTTLPVIIGQPVQAVSSIASLVGVVTGYLNNQLTMTVTNTPIQGVGTANSWTISGVVESTLRAPGYKYIPIVPIDYFLSIVLRFDLTQNFVFEYTFPSSFGGTFTFRARNDIAPSLCTVVENEFVLFDQYDKTQDVTLQASKTLAYGQVVPPFTLQDDFIPFLDDQQFPLLLNEAKSLAFYELKQMPHAKADQEIQRQWTVTQARKSKSNKPSYFDALPDYGRVPRTGGYGGYPLWRFMRNSANFNSSI